MTRAARLTTRRDNPFAGEKSAATGTCVAMRDGRLHRVPEADEAVPPFVEFVHDSFRALVLNRHFSCVGAKTAVHAESYRLGVYEDMGAAESTAGLARDLFEFVEDRREASAPFETFVAAFTGPVVGDEKAFEERLWAQLRALHALDRPHHEWDPHVSPDPEDPKFAFSFAEHAFFVVGLHPASSRWARRFTWPTLVFNPHAQFRRLRDEGRYEAFRDAIRARDVRLQGLPNPMLNDHGDASDARQYSGRAVEDGWRCPFPHGREEQA